MTTRTWCERDRGGVHGGAVQGREGDAAVHAIGILHGDRVAAPAVVPSHAEVLPGCRYARRHGEGVPLRAQAEDRLEPEPVHPGCRAGVPRPAAATHVRCPGVDVGREDERLRLVATDVGGRAGVVDGVEHVEQLDGLVAVAELRQGHHRPQCRMRVLAAVLAHAGQVALDVARIERGRVEGRGAPPSSARWSRCGIPRVAPNRAACRRRSTRGDTSRRPTPARA